MQNKERDTICKRHLDDTLQSLYNMFGAIVIMHGSRVGMYKGSGHSPLKNRKNIGFLNNRKPDPLKNYKATVLPAKSDMTSCFVYKVIRDL